VTEYRKAAGDPDGMLELMIYYVECGTACTADYGDIDGWGYYDYLADRFAEAFPD
jgi:hypothetical protein